MIHRAYEDVVSEMLTVFPVVALVGPRQVGKSTLVTRESMTFGRRYATLDSIPERSLAQSDPVGFLNAPEPMTIDEIQLVPELLREMKRRVDIDRTPGNYLITGSADLNYAADLSHILAGRVGIVELPPITQFEMHRESDRETTRPRWASFVAHGPEGITGDQPNRLPYSFSWNALATGGFPLSVTAASARARALWIDSFRTTYLERDLRRLSDVGNLAGFSRLMELTAARTATVLNQAGLARDAGLPTQTTARYVSILEASLLIRRIPGWFANIGKRIVKSPKLVWRDTGIATYLTGIDPDRLEHHPLRGALFESFVLEEIAALLPVYLHGARLFHLRTHDGLEIDAIIQHGGKLIPIEIKGRHTVSADDAKPIERWMELERERSSPASAGPAPSPWGAVMYPGERVQQLSRHVWALPIV